MLLCMWAWSVMSDSKTPWTVAHQAPLFMGFPRQEYWSGLPFPSPGDLPDPEIEPVSLASPTLVGVFFTTAPPGKPLWIWDLSPIPLASPGLLLLATSKGWCALSWSMSDLLLHSCEWNPIPAWTAADAAMSSCRRLSSNWSHLNLCLLRCIKGKMKKRKIDEEEFCVLCLGQSMDTKGLLAASFSEVSMFSLLKQEESKRNPSSLYTSRVMK